MSCQALERVGSPYPIVIQRAEDLLGVFGRLLPHGAIAEVPPELMQGDQTAWTLVHELSDNYILDEIRVIHVCDIHAIEVETKMALKKICNDFT